jgi:hypothetical protein
MAVRNVLLGVGACLAAAHAGAQQVQVSKGSEGCASLVRLVARDAPLSRVLQELATALDFKVQFDAEADPRVSLEASKRPVALINALAPGANVSITQARDPKCPGQYRIAKVWVLPQGKAASTAAASRPLAAQAEYRPQGPGTYEGADRAHNPD